MVSLVHYIQGHSKQHLRILLTHAYLLNLHTHVTFSLETATVRHVFFPAKYRVQQLCI